MAFVFILILFLFERYTGKTINAINLGSYNYLGFAEKSGPCATDAVNAIKTFGVANCNTRVEIGMKYILILLDHLNEKEID
jgi:7-keto-8-aminopelargonate synthetase-like enzyme